MRVAVVGGTTFIGRRIVEALAARGDEVLVVHRGQHCPADWVEVRHLHVDRADLPDRRGEIADFAPDAVVDTYALSARDADLAIAALPEVPTVVLSSQDVYEAFAALSLGGFASPVPLTEEAELRRRRYPYRDIGPEEKYQEYDKLDVEERYLPRGAVVLRLPAVYGPHDSQLREWPVLRRVLAGRTRIPLGVGNLLWSRVHVEDAARSVLAALDSRAADGLALNIGEAQVYPISAWWQQIAQAAGAEVEFVTVPDGALPDDLSISGPFAQHIVADVSRAAEVLGWRAGDPAARVRESVAWHLANPREFDWTESDAEADDAALAAAVSG